MKKSFMSIFADFAFERVFGSDVNKDLMIDFVNALLEECEPRDSKLINAEYYTPPIYKECDLDYGGVCDAVCRTDIERKSVVQFHKVRKKKFKDRYLFFSNAAVSSHDELQWSYNKIDRIYIFGFSNFTVREGHEDVIGKSVLCGDDGSIFTKLWQLYFLELHKFKKDETQLETKLDKWFYALKNLDSFEKRPDVLSEDVFVKLFDAVDISKLTEAEKAEYEESLKKSLSEKE